MIDAIAPVSSIENLVANILELSIVLAKNTGERGISLVETAESQTTFVRGVRVKMVVWSSMREYESEHIEHREPMTQ